MSFILMELVANALDTMLVFYFLVKIFKKEKIIQKKDFIYFLGLIILNTLINMVFDNISILAFLAVFAISNTVYSFFLEEKLYRTFVFSILATGIMFLIEIIVVSAFLLTFKITPAMLLELNIYRIIGVTASKGSFYLFIKYFVGKFKLPIYMKSDKTIYIAFIGLFNILIMFIAFKLYEYIEVESTLGYLYLLCIGLGTIIFSIVMYLTSKRMLYQNQQEMIWKVKEEEFHKKDFYINNMNDILQTIRSQRHDLNNYLGTLYGLMALDDFEDAKRYIGKINERVSKMNTIIETSHPVITALLSIKKNRAFDDGIDMQFDLGLPNELPYDYVDLSIIIGNLLDNAIEACQLIGKEDEKIIDVFMGIEDDYFNIRICNSKNDSINLEKEKLLGRFTTKKDSQNHGLGLGNVEFIVNQYKGSLDINDLDDEFVVEISLPLDMQNHGVNSTTMAMEY